MGKRPECAMGGGMAVAADNGHARLGAALLGPHHVDDAVADISHRKKFNPVVFDIALQGLELQPRLLIGHRAYAPGLAFGRDVVIGHCERAVRPPHRPVVRPQARKGLGRRHLMDQVQVDIEDRLAVLLGDEVRIPNLVVEGLAGHGADLGCEGRLCPGSLCQWRVAMFALCRQSRHWLQTPVTFERRAKRIIERRMRFSP